MLVYILHGSLYTAWCTTRQGNVELVSVIKIVMPTNIADAE